MSYYCHACKKIVQGEKRILIPSVVRKVKYIGTMLRKSYRRDEEPTIIYTGDSEGWEIVEAVSVCKSLAEGYKEGNPPREDKQVKEVKFFRPRRRQITEEVEQERYDDRPAPRKVITSIEQVEIGREF